VAFEAGRFAGGAGFTGGGVIGTSEIVLPSSKVHCQAHCHPWQAHLPLVGLLYPFWI
jgi:hypothetical protein